MKKYENFITTMEHYPCYSIAKTLFKKIRKKYKKIYIFTKVR